MRFDVNLNPSDAMSGMPWLAVQFGSDVIGTLVDMFDAERDPKLLLVCPTGAVLCKDVSTRIESEPEGYPWLARHCKVGCRMLHERCRVSGQLTG
jgi:hypothetical protein